MPAPSIQLQQSRRTIFILILLSTCYQALALLGALPINTQAQQTIYDSSEIALILVLLFQSWKIRQALKAKYEPLLNEEHRWVLGISKLCLVSLAICILGDVTNANYFQLYYQHGSNVKHSYLADSVWFFFPGYACFIYAAYRVGLRNQLSRSFMMGTAILCGGIGSMFYALMHQEGAGWYVTMLTGPYAGMISVMCAAALWLLKSYPSYALKWIALGAALAAIADALIGQFWIFSDWYPTIGYINWIVYFASQALIQLLPIELDQLHAHSQPSA